MTGSRASGMRIVVLVVACALAVQFATPNRAFAAATINLTKLVRNYGSSSGFSTSATAQPGQMLQYSITYSVSAGTAVSLLVRDNTPSSSGQSYQTCYGAPCSYSGGVITYNIGGVPAGTSGTVYFNALVNSGFQGTISNTATAVESGGGTATSNTTSVFVNVTPSASTTLALSKQACRGTTCGSSVTASNGNTLTYNIAYTNTGGAQANNVTVTDALQAGQTYVSCSGAICSQSGGTVTFTVGSVASGGSGVLSITTTVNVATGTITNQAQATASNAPTVGSNTTSVFVGGAGATTLTLGKSVCSLGACGTSVASSPGSAVQYNLTYTNTGGTNAATTPMIQDVLQPGQTYSSVACTPACTVIVSGSTVTFSYPSSVAPGSSVTATITTIVNAGFSGTITNQGTASAANAASVNSGTTTVSVGIPVTPATSISLQKMVRDATQNGAFSTTAAAFPGDLVTYQLTVSNTGAVAASGVTVSDNVQSGQTLSSSCGPATCSMNGGQVVFNVGTLNPGTAAVETFSVFINPATTVPNQRIDNVATAGATNAATVASNHTTITVSPTATTVTTAFPFGFIQFVEICGTVTAYTPPTSVSAGLITIGGVTFQLMPQLIPSGLPVTVGGLSCVTFTTNASGQIASMLVSANVSNTIFICGTISPALGTQTCFLLSPTGQIVGSLSVIPTAATPVDTEGAFFRRGGQIEE